LPNIGKNGSRRVEKRIITPKHDRWADQNSFSKGFPNRQFALAALSDIERLRTGIGTDTRNMNELFDSGSLGLSRDLLGRPSWME